MDFFSIFVIPTHVWLKGNWNIYASICIQVVLKERDQHSWRSNNCVIKSMSKIFLAIFSVYTDFQTTCLCIDQGWSSFLPQSISSVLETMLQHPGISLSGLPGHQSSIPVYEPEYPRNETDQQCSATVCQTTSCCPLDCKLRSSPASQTGGYGKRLSLQVHEHLSLYGSMENNL